MIERTCVRLTDDDRASARACAELRIRDAHKVGAVDRFGEDSEASHYYGALGEIVVARTLGIPWHCHSKRWARQADVGPYEVRAIPPATKPYVKTKPNDPPDRQIVIVLLCTGPDCGLDVLEGVIAGTIIASRVREVGRWSDPGRRGAPCWMAELEDLSPWGVLR